MQSTPITFFDTDMFIHKLSPDLPVRQYVEENLVHNSPSAMSEFSIVEFKGNYIASLILLRRKISDSDTLESAFSRIQNSGGRKAALMLAQLIKWLGGTSFPVKPWVEAKNALLTYLDAQIEIVWLNFINSVGNISRQFNCTRAMEEPQDNDGKWTATIPKCRNDNTSCQINKFITNFDSELRTLISDIERLPNDKLTEELNKIGNISRKIIESKNFSWQGQTCRKIGDLLIGLESRVGLCLFSSNYKEHSVLSKSLGYGLKLFEVAKIRSK